MGRTTATPGEVDIHHTSDVTLFRILGVTQNSTVVVSLSVNSFCGLPKLHPAFYLGSSQNPKDSYLVCSRIHNHTPMNILLNVLRSTPPDHLGGGGGSRSPPPPACKRLLAYMKGVLTSSLVHVHPRLSQCPLPRCDLHAPFGYGLGSQAVCLSMSDETQVRV